MKKLWKKVRMPLALVLALLLALECTNLMSGATLFAYDGEDAEQTESAPKQETPVVVEVPEKPEVQEQPVEEAPAKEEPAAEVPVAAQAPTQEEPAVVEEAPVAVDTPVQEQPVAVEEVPVVEEVPAEEAPAEEVPSAQDETPVIEDTPTQDTDAEEVPVDSETPAEEQVVEEEAPSEEQVVEVDPSAEQEMIPEEELTVLEQYIEEHGFVYAKTSHAVDVYTSAAMNTAKGQLAAGSLVVATGYKKADTERKTAVRVVFAGSDHSVVSGYVSEKDLRACAAFSKEEALQLGAEYVTANVGVNGIVFVAAYTPVAEEEAAEETPVDEVVVEEEPAEETPAGEVVVEEPAEETPVDEVVVEEEPAEETPVDEVVAEEEPAEETPAEEVVVEEEPADEVVVEEDPTEEAPVDEVVVEEEPVLDIPVQEPVAAVTPADDQATEEEEMATATDLEGPVTMVDEGTGVTVTLDQDAIPEGVMLVDVAIRVVPVTIPVEVLSEAAENGTVVQLVVAYDISLIDTVTGMVFEPVAPIQVIIPIPEEAQGELNVVHITDNNEVETVQKVNVQNDYVAFDAAAL